MSPENPVSSPCFPGLCLGGQLSLDRIIPVFWFQMIQPSHKKALWDSEHLSSNLTETGKARVC